MKLISELNEEVKLIAEEGTEGKKNLFITGPFIQTEVTNRNRRRYVRETVEREVKRYTEQYIDKNRALGELGHPDGPSINLDRVCIKIVELKQNGNDFIGKARILETPMGLIAKNLIESGVQLGVSTRGMGSLVEKNGVMEVQDDFYLATAADVVADPSAPNAFVNGIMEGVDWVWDGKIFKAQHIERAKKLVESAPKTNLEDVKLRVFNHFLSNIR